MALAHEMESKPRPTPGLVKTLESVMNIVRQSRGEPPAPASRSAQRRAVDEKEIKDLFSADLSTSGRDEPLPPKSLTAEQQDAEDLARVRAALYSD
ncbi:hypothetical protein [Histidinibacterium aquaticum]|uniref:Uncharacterized protein n=1 Tax=Histidinibacterium aquaticum TaxID=2613962 RepID=A0A5J5GPW0_9RHOB|nr:hypothetical protein [Histidinibacterium aquaticum]KAA9009783.1 hypothetical protein F3S47_00500 [Histidinibacterium aquaticum]